MNKNKGFIGMGLIIAIVLGAIIIGGGAYYLGKSNNKLEVKSPENILPNNQNQNLPVVDNSQQVNVVNPTTPTVATGCTSSSVPSITVLSPNGGEIYKAGDKVTVKWKSCNFHPSISAGGADIVIFISNLSGSGLPNWMIGEATKNDGQELITLPTTLPDGSPLSYGKNFKISVGKNDPSAQSEGIGDSSDNSFTINAVPKTVSTLLSGYIKYSGNAPFTFTYKADVYKPDVYMVNNLSRYIVIDSLGNDNCDGISISTMSFGKKPVCTEMTNKYSQVKNYCRITTGSITGTTYKVEASTSEVCGNPPSKEARDFVDHLASELAGQ